MDRHMGGKYSIDWSKGGSFLLDNNQGVPADGLLLYWTELRDYLSNSSPSDHPIQNYLEHVDRCVQSHLSGDYKFDESLMSLANQIEDIVFALELQSVEREKKK